MDYIEDLIERENTFTMTEFAVSINEFLTFRKYDIQKEKDSTSKKKQMEKLKKKYMMNSSKINSVTFDKQVKNQERWREKNE